MPPILFFIFIFSWGCGDLKSNKDTKKGIELKPNIGNESDVRFQLEELKTLLDSNQVESASTKIKKIDFTSLVKKEDLSDFYYLKGIISFKGSNLDSALFFLKKALEINRLKRKNHLSTANSYHYIATINHLKGEYEHAIINYKNALKIKQSVLDSNDLSIADTYNNIGVYFVDIGDYNLGIVNHTKALRIRLNSGVEGIKIADSYNNIGLLYEQIGQNEKALNFLMKALVIKKGFGDFHNSLIKTLSNIGNVKINQGKLYEGYEYYKKALKYCNKNYSEPNSCFALVYGNIGNFFSKTYQYEKAEEYYLRALKVELEMNSKRALVERYNNLGILYLKMKRFDNSIRYLLKSKDLIFSDQVLKNNFLMLKRIFNNLGVAYNKKEDYQESLRIYFEAEQYLIAAMKNSTEIADENLSEVYLNIGLAYYKLDKLSNSFLFLNKAMALLKGQNNSNKLLLAHINKCKGVMYAEKNQNEKALNCFYAGLKSLNLDSPSIDGAEGFLRENPHISLLYQIAKINQFQFNSTDSINYIIESNLNLKKAFKAIGQFTAQLEDRKITEELIQDISLVYEASIINNIILFNNSTQKKIASSIFKEFEDIKSNQLLYELKLRTIRNSFGVPQIFLDKELELKFRLTILKKEMYEMLSSESDPEKKDSILSFFTLKKVSLKEAKDSLFKEIETHLPDYFDLKYKTNRTTLKIVQDSLLTPNQALIEYFVGDNSIFVFTIQKDTFHINEIKKDFPFKEWVDDLLKGIYDPFINKKDHSASAEKYAEAASKLYQKIFEPIDTLLPEATELIIVPDGILGYVPFDALLVKRAEDPTSFRNHEYLLQDHQISYAYSATLLHEMKNKKHQKEPRRGLLAYAPTFPPIPESPTDSIIYAYNPTRSSNTRDYLKPLKYNIEEAEVIQGHIGGKVVSGMEATETNFIKEAENYRFIHLPTHAKANDKVGDYCYLAFAEVEDSIENERLYNSELYNLRLNADMVVLSACETGTGELQRGEGIISLARGFSYAGAKSIITSLWNVDDKSTRIIMEDFYKNLKEGMTKDAALWNAKKDYFENESQVEPFYWAAFIPIGDMSPVELNSSDYYWWVFAVVTGLISLFLFWKIFFKNKNQT